LHPEKLPSAIERYTAEAKRILSVLDGALEGRDWLVGDKMTYADLAFVPWNERLQDIFKCEVGERFEGFANVERWHERMTGRASWKKIQERRVQLMDEQGLLPNGMPKGMRSFEEYGKKIGGHGKEGCGGVICENDIFGFLQPFLMIFKYHFGGVKRNSAILKDSWTEQNYPRVDHVVQLVPSVAT
jgi:hypothetical protein